MIIKKLMEEFPDQFAEYAERILDGYFGNMFIVLRNKRILYVNERMAASVKMSKEELCSMTIDELRAKKLWAKSISKELYEDKRFAFNAYNVNTLTGEELFTHVEPFYNEKGEIVLSSQISIPRTMLTQFSSYIDKEAANFENYKHISDYLGDKNNAAPLIFESPAAKNTLKTAAYISGLDNTILITGQTGTGKDVLAKYICKNSSRSNQPFIPVNCSAIPAELMESEFFGYEKGAFTGARDGGKPGLFEMANNGTLFLDEIGELPLSMQAKFLRVLENGEYMHVGGSKICKTDVRIIAATNRDLKQLVAEGQFREDLYYRLSIMPLHLPSLKERPEDIPALAEAFISQYNKKYLMSKTLDEYMIKDMLEYSWPGNIRELRNVIERYVISGIWDIAPSALKNAPDKEKKAAESNGESAALHAADDFDYSLPLHEACDEFEKRYIIKAIKDSGGSMEKSAERLGIHRSLLYKKRKKYGI